MRRITLFVALALVFAACGENATPRTVRLLTHDFFAVSDELLDAFSAETGFEVQIVRGGDAGIVVNQSILTAGNPLADVIFGVDTTLLSRAIGANLFDPYRSPELEFVPPDFHVALDEATPIDFGDVCLNYDKGLLANPPSALRDLASPAYSGLLVVPDPTISTPGLAFLLATIDEFGETGDYTWRDFWSDLRANDVQIVGDWGTAYYGSFSGTGGGDRPIVVSYASSPPAEVLFADPPIDQATTGVIEAGCFRQVEYAGVLRGAENQDGARALIDFMLSAAFQQSVPTSMFVFPVRSGTELPEVFVANTRVPANPAVIDPDAIDHNRERWLAEWIETVLR
jgi:thiamine transport system substrate-binding protein